MNIHILTLPLRDNYGGILQNYALVNILQRYGYKVHTVNIQIKTHRLPYRKLPEIYYKRFFNKLLRKPDSIIFLEQKLWRNRHLTDKGIQDFISKYIPLTQKTYYSKEDLKKLNNDDIYAFIVGSDQVWRPEYVHLGIETNFLDFIENYSIKRIGYGVSFGFEESEMRPEQFSKCSQLLKKFNSVSVREYQSIDWFDRIFNWNFITPEFVADPTLLLKKEDYLQILSTDKKSDDAGLFYYILDPNKDKIDVIEFISKKLGLKSSGITNERVNTDNKLIVKCSVEEWIANFNKAQFIITDSYHGCIFSLIFNKPFIVYKNSERGNTRFDSLIKVFDIGERFISSCKDLDNKIINNKIDWANINSKKDSFANSSIDFLLNSLQK